MDAWRGSAPSGICHAAGRQGSEGRCEGELEKQFYQLALGARFEYRGKAYIKTAMDSARDEDGRPQSINRAWEVSPIGEPLLMSPEEAELWKPLDLDHWADHLEPSPIERGDWGKTEPNP